MSFLTIVAALARFSASSEKSRCFKASFNRPLMASLKTKTVFLPSVCSWSVPLKCSNKAIFSLVLFMVFLMPRSSSLWMCNDDSSESYNNRVPFSIHPSVYSTSLTNAIDLSIISPLHHLKFELSVHKVIYTDFLDRSGISNGI